MGLCLIFSGCGDQAYRVAASSNITNASHPLAPSSPETNGASTTVPATNTQPTPPPPVVTPAIPPTQAAACEPLGSTCGFNYSGGYPSTPTFASNEKECRITYYKPGTNSSESVTKTFYTNCGTCIEAVFENGAAASVEGAVSVSSGVTCSGSPLMDIQYESQYSFSVQTVSGCTEQYPRYFTFLLTQCN